MFARHSMHDMVLRMSHSSLWRKMGWKSCDVTRTVIRVRIDGGVQPPQFSCSFKCDPPQLPPPKPLVPAVLLTLPVHFSQFEPWLSLHVFTIFFIIHDNTKFIIIIITISSLFLASGVDLELIPRNDPLQCNLGFIFDSDMSFTDQINSLSKSCHFHIRDIRRIRHLLPLSAATALANSLVSSKLDYCNSLYNGISQANLNKI